MEQAPDLLIREQIEAEDEEDKSIEDLVKDALKPLAKILKKEGKVLTNKISD